MLDLVPRAQSPENSSKKIAPDIGAVLTVVEHMLQEPFNLPAALARLQPIHSELHFHQEYSAIEEGNVSVEQHISELRNATYSESISLCEEKVEDLGLVRDVSVLGRTVG